MKRFIKCNIDVKAKLLKAYLSSFYCSSLWNKFTLAEYNKVKAAYNRVFRKFMNVDIGNMYCCMVKNRIKSFREIERDLVYSFRCRLEKCKNVIVHEIFTSLFNINSPMTKYWNKVLYVWTLYHYYVHILYIYVYVFFFLYSLWNVSSFYPKNLYIFWNK